MEENKSFHFPSSIENSDMSLLETHSTYEYACIYPPLDLFMWLRYEEN